MTVRRSGIGLSSRPVPSIDPPPTLAHPMEELDPNERG
jgi:hypothetical protein